jgi:hypothetical protein
MDFELELDPNNFQAMARSKIKEVCDLVRWRWCPKTENYKSCFDPKSMSKIEEIWFELAFEFYVIEPR